MQQQPQEKHWSTLYEIVCVPTTSLQYPRDTRSVWHVRLVKQSTVQAFVVKLDNDTTTSGDAGQHGTLIPLHNLSFKNGASEALLDLVHDIQTEQDPHNIPFRVIGAVTGDRNVLLVLSWLIQVNAELCEAQLNSFGHVKKEAQICKILSMLEPKMAQSSNSLPETPKGCDMDFSTPKPLTMQGWNKDLPLQAFQTGAVQKMLRMEEDDTRPRNVDCCEKCMIYPISKSYGIHSYLQTVVLSSHFAPNGEKTFGCRLHPVTKYLSNPFGSGKSACMLALYNEDETRLYDSDEDEYKQETHPLQHYLIQSRGTLVVTNGRGGVKHWTCQHAKFLKNKPMIVRKINSAADFEACTATQLLRTDLLVVRASFLESSAYHLFFQDFLIRHTGSRTTERSLFHITRNIVCNRSSLPKRIPLSCIFWRRVIYDMGEPSMKNLNRTDSTNMGKQLWSRYSWLSDGSQQKADNSQSHNSTSSCVFTLTSCLLPNVPLPILHMHNIPLTWQEQEIQAMFLGSKEQQLFLCTLGQTHRRHNQIRIVLDARHALTQVMDGINAMNAHSQNQSVSIDRMALDPLFLDVPRQGAHLQTTTTTIMHSNSSNEMRRLRFLKTQLEHGAESSIPVCPICFERPSTLITQCGHWFCKHCLLTAWSNNDQCPVCKFPLDSQLSPEIGPLRQSHESRPEVAANKHSLPPVFQIQADPSDGIRGSKIARLWDIINQARESHENIALFVQHKTLYLHIYQLLCCRFNSLLILVGKKCASSSSDSAIGTHNNTELTVYKVKSPLLGPSGLHPHKILLFSPSFQRDMELDQVDKSCDLIAEKIRHLIFLDPVTETAPHELCHKVSLAYRLDQRESVHVHILVAQNTVEDEIVSSPPWVDTWLLADSYPNKASV